MLLLTHAIALPPVIEVGMDEYLYPADNSGCDYLSMPLSQSQ